MYDLCVGIRYVRGQVGLGHRGVRKTENKRKITVTRSLLDMWECASVRNRVRTVEPAASSAIRTVRTFYYYLHARTDQTSPTSFSGLVLIRFIYSAMCTRTYEYVRNIERVYLSALKRAREYKRYSREYLESAVS